MQYKKDEIKEKIISAAAMEFEKNGFQSALIKDIASQSAVPVGNIYRYFKSKEDLFDAVVGNMYKMTPFIIQKIYEKQLSGNYKVRDIAKEIAESIMEIYSGHSRELIILVYKSEGTRYGGFISELSAFVTGIVQKELFKNADACDIKIAELITNGFLNGFFDILRTADNKNIKELIERHVRFYFNRVEERI